jgi:hypothetical protein
MRGNSYLTSYSWLMAIILFAGFGSTALAQDYALDFGGSGGNRYVYCQNLFVSGSAPRTVEAWVNPRTFTTNAGVFECGNGASGSGLINFGLRIGNSNEWKVELHDETLIYISTGTLNTWNHFALVYDGANVKLYHNGNLVINVARSINTYQSSFLIGRLADGFFDGKIDEVRFWNVARTQAQIQSAMYTELAGNENGLLVEYRMNENTGTTTQNSSTRSDLNSNFSDYKNAVIRYDASWVPGFTSSFVLPTVTTQAVTAITTTTATGNGNITNLGVPNPTQYGVCWSTTANPTIALSTKTEQGAKSATGAFTSSMTSLTPGTLYHVRAYVTNSAGTSYGEDVQFTALKTPTVTTQAVTAITTTTATGNGNVINLGVPNPTQYGVCWGAAANPTIALSTRTDQGAISATGAFTSPITSLTPGTLYHVRAYVTNSAGTSYGEDVQFTALKTPTVTTQAVTDITATTATGNGDVTYLGIPNPIQYGVCWNTSGNPTTADNKTQKGSISATGAFTSSIIGLSGSTTYYVRAYATNTVGTSYGEQVQCTTLIAGDGTAGNPYQIANLNDLLWIYNNSTKWNCSFIQTNEINASSTNGWNINWEDKATGWMPIGNSSLNFTGSYDGNGHGISGLYINRGSSDYQALFGIINGAIIKNLKLTDVSIKGSLYTGGLAGVSDNSSQINNCSVAGNVTGSYYTGGIAANNNTSSTISNCFTTGSVSATGGGVGGLTESNYGTISNCYSTASVSASSNTGGLTSSNGGTIRNCYCIGSITLGSISGGLCGANLSGCTIINSFWNTETSNQSTSAGGGTGKTTAEMKVNTLFINVGWDFNIWNMGDGINGGYPYLKWQYPVGTPLPIELSSFTAAAKNNKVTLSWTTATEVSNYGFDVERASTSLGITWAKIGFVQGHGNSNSPMIYSFVDSNPASGDVQYRLKQIDFGGTYEYKGVVEVKVQTPTEFKLAQNFPNPFNPETTINYQLPTSGHVTLKICDLLGKEVTELVNEEKSSGNYEVKFNATSLPSGIYFYKLQSGPFTQTNKLLLIK